MRPKTLALPLLLLLLFAPRPAAADGFLSPYVGASFGGDLDRSRPGYGVSLGFMSGGVFGLEFDFAYSPEFFEPPDDDFDFIDDSNLTTLMVNIIVGVPVGGEEGRVRPYVAGGAGLMKSRVQALGDLIDIDNNDFGLNFGGGVMGFFTDSVGVRGDLRYFRAFSEDEESGFDLDLGDFNFWRGTVGVTFRF